MQPRLDPAARVRALLGSLLLSVVLVASGCDVFGGQQEASCAGPDLSVEPPRATVGGEFRLHGVAFARGGCETSAEPNPGVRIELRQGPKAWRLASVDVGRDSTFDIRLRVPTGVSPGQAVLSAAGGPKTAEEPFVVTDKATGSRRS